jgi:hypothetical protein
VDIGLEEGYIGGKENPPMARDRELEEAMEIDRQIAEHKKKERDASVFQYAAKCTECSWEVTWESSDTWRKGGPREHANDMGHIVKTVMHSEKVLLPQGESRKLDGDKKPGPSDKYMAYCNECKAYVGVNAGRFFNAAWKAHSKRTGHGMTVGPNKKYRPPID